jgi:hypothetical protein
MINMGVRFGFLFSKPSSLETFVCNLLQLKNVLLANVFQNLHCAQPHVICTYRTGKGIHLLIIISGQGEKLETKLGMQGEMEK